MNSVSKFTWASGGAVWLAIGVLSAPAQAALLDFNLAPNSPDISTLGVSNISFTLDTDPKSISNLELNNSPVTPTTSDFFGPPEFRIGTNGNISFLDLDFAECSGYSYNCILGRDFTIIEVDLEFSGVNLFNQLSSDPNAYLSSFVPGVGSLARIFPGSGGYQLSGSTVFVETYNYEFIAPVTSLSVTRKEVPEPTGIASIVGFGVLGAGLLLKRGRF